MNIDPETRFRQDVTQEYLFWEYFVCNIAIFFAAITLY